MKEERPPAVLLSSLIPHPSSLQRIPHPFNESLIPSTNPSSLQRIPHPFNESLIPSNIVQARHLQGAVSFDGLVNGFAAAEAEPAIQADGSLVLGGHLQEGPAQAGAGEAV